jgi:hypothetical protein
MKKDRRRINAGSFFSCWDIRKSMLDYASFVTRGCTTCIYSLLVRE